MSEGVTDGERWHFGDRYYGITLASTPSSMDLELDDLGPSPGRGLVLLASFVDDADEITIRSFSDEPLPLELVEQFTIEARRRLPVTA